jgi:hypothetical protein
MELSEHQSHYLIKRLPKFELSYETISHKKVSPYYNLAMAIPNGKKYYLWFSFYKSQNVCYLMDVNRDKKITKITILENDFESSYALGTILYGSILENAEGEKIEDHFFAIEDIFYYKGISTRNMCFGDKLGYIREFLSRSKHWANEPIAKKNQSKQNNTIKSVFFTLPMMWYIRQTVDYECPAQIPVEISNCIGYVPHHLQYRSLTTISPYLNVFLTRKLNNIREESNTIVSNTSKVCSFQTLNLRMVFSRPQYKSSAVFQVTADIQFDVYHLFAYGKNKTTVYYNVACIPNYKTSVFMNGLFRNIRENSNLDYIEESDDEDDFENISEDKYVDLNKTLFMECIFNYKCKKWVPIRVVYKPAKIVHIHQLADVSY